MDTKALIEKRIKLGEDCKVVLEKAATEKRALTAEEQQSFDRMGAEISALKGTLDSIASQEAEERSLAESRGRRTEHVPSNEGDKANSEDQELAFRGWALGRHATDEMRAAAVKCGVRIDQTYIDMASRISRDASGKEVRSFFAVKADNDGSFREKRALSIGTTTAGGNSVPNEVMRAFYEVQKWYGSARAAAQVVQTESGATLPWPTVSDTANSGRVLAEATAATTTTDPTFGVVNVGAYKFSSDAVLVSWELLQDSFIDLASYLGRALGTRIGRIQNTKFTIGAGTTEPTGIVVGSAAGVTSGATNSFTLDDIITLIHSVDPAYRAMPGVGFMMHDTIAMYVRKFKDGQGRYLWETSTQLGVPDKLFGYPVSINNDMAVAFTTGQKLALFGAFSHAFLVRDAGAVRFIRADELYALQHQVMFEASQRSSSEVLDTTAIKHLKTA